MKKITLLIAIFLVANSLIAQKYFTKTGHISFFSTTPVEDIKADNYQSSSVINFENGDIVFSVLMKGFEFEKALMQEHFNEKYVESDEFPKTKFTGNIKNFETVNLSKNGAYEVEVEGKMTLHGVSKEVSTNGTLVVKYGLVSGKADFVLAPEDYEINIPAMVRDKIAKTVTITVDMEYKEFKRK
mgnify:CR=1 FL=1